MHRPIRHVCAPLLPCRFACRISAPRRMPAYALMAAPNAGSGTSILNYMLQVRSGASLDTVELAS